MALSCAVSCRARFGPLVAVNNNSPAASASASAAVHLGCAFEGHSLRLNPRAPLAHPRCCSSMDAARSVSCAASQPDSTDATVPDPTPTVLEFQPSSNMPVMPPEWKVREEKRKAEEALLNTQGINIRRRPATGPPLHNVGPFQFKIQSEGNIPRNILEEIVWHKDVEVAQMKERTPLTALAKAMTGVGPTLRRRNRGTRSLTRDRAMTVSCSSNGGASASLPEKRVLVGCGGAALDFLASVEKFPQPDDKIRSTELKVQGGGNVGNALTAAARLGLDCRIFTKVANDGPGAQILSELQGDGVDVSNVVVAEEGVSPFTYVIVDKETNTRTCIHTPGSPLLEPQELTRGIIDRLLDRADLVYFDGRLADTALLLAEESSKRQLPMLVDAERPREGLDNLLTYATYVVSSAKFPQSWTAAATLAEALLEMMLRLPQLKFVIVTLGASGCIMLERHIPDSTEAELDDGAVEVNGLVESLLREADELRNLHSTAVSSKICKLCSADISNVQQQIWGRFHVGTAEVIPAAELVDTTGAGDGFIGGVMYAILAGLSPQKLLALGATVGAGSCRALGARPGLPTRMDPKVVSLL